MIDLRINSIHDAKGSCVPVLPGNCLGWWTCFQWMGVKKIVYVVRSMRCAVMDGELGWGNVVA